MEQVYMGIVVVVLCTAGYLVSYRKQVAGQYGIAVLLLVVCGLLLRMFVAADPFLHFWDERYHALVGKNLMHHLLKPTLYEHPVLPYRFESWEYNQVWVHKQPVTLWLIALSLKLFGVHAWAVRVPSIILSTIAIKLVYDVGHRLYDCRTGYVAAFLLSIHGLIIELAGGRVATDHVDVAFMFFVLLAVWCSTFLLKNGTGDEQRSSGWLVWTALAGISIGLAVLCKWLPAFVVLPVVMVLLCRSERNVLRLAGVGAMMLIAALLVAVPWQLYILHHYPAEAAWEYHFNMMHFKEVLADQGGNFLYHFDKVRMNYGEAVYLPLVWLTYLCVRKRKPEDIAIAIWFWVPYLFFSFSATKMQAYTLFAAPAVFLATARGYYGFKEVAATASKNKWLYLVPAYAMVLLPIRYTIERVKPFTQLDRHPQWLTSVQALKASAYNTNRTVVLNSSHPLETMFETDCIAYPGYGAIPSPPAELGLRVDS